jgi:hypothetical protein
MKSIALSIGSCVSSLTSWAIYAVPHGRGLTQLAKEHARAQHGDCMFDGSHAKNIVYYIRYIHYIYACWPTLHMHTYTHTHTCVHTQHSLTCPCASAFPASAAACPSPLFPSTALLLLLSAVAVAAAAAEASGASSEVAAEVECSESG